MAHYHVNKDKIILWYFEELIIINLINDFIN